MSDFNPRGGKFVRREKGGRSRTFNGGRGGGGGGGKGGKGGNRPGKEARSQARKARSQS